MQNKKTQKTPKPAEVNLAAALSTIASRPSPIPIGRRRASLAASKIACLVDIGELPDADSAFFLVMDRRWAMADLVPVCRELGGPIEALTIFTLGWSRQTAGEICEAKETGACRSIRIVCSQYFAKTDRACYGATAGLFDAAKIPVAVVRSHIKAMIFTFTSHPPVVFMGSGNLRSCSSFENLTATGAPAVAAMMERLADEMFADPAAFCR